MKASKVFGEQNPAAHNMLVRMDGIDRAKFFHDAFGLKNERLPTMPTVTERILRGTLMLEEFMEFLEDGLGLTLCYEFADDKLDRSLLQVLHFEGDIYDPVETLDGLADIKVIANGTAACFGLPMADADWEVFCSNMTKLDSDGKPIVNSCTFCGNDGRNGGSAFPDLEQHDCQAFANDSSKPIGKILKPPHYTPADISTVLIESYSHASG